MGAFRGAVVVGSHAIETDLHLSKDGVVVLSHVGFSDILLSCFYSFVCAREFVWGGTLAEAVWTRPGRLGTRYNQRLMWDTREL